MTTSLRDIIRRPLVSEKMARLQGDHKDETVCGAGEWYAFEVEKSANKAKVKRAVEELYASQKISVVKVRTMRCRGRIARVGANVSGIRTWKKALVQLADGQKIAQG